MTATQLNDLQTYLVHEFVEDYEDGLMSRRDMMSRVLHITGSVTTTATLLTTLGVSSAAAQDALPATIASPAAGGAKSPISVAADDPAIHGGPIQFPNGSDTIQAYEARPATSATPAERPAVVLVCHENRGLTDHIRDVARRFAKEGYVACAVDLLSREGGTDHIADPSQIPSLLTNVDPMRHVSDFQAAATYYQGQFSVDGRRLGMNGYCFGGGITWRAVTAMPELKAAAPYYGPPPPLDGVKNIKAAVLGVYSSDPNDFANNGRDQLEAALKQAGVTFEIKIYPGTQHAFNNDTGPRYNEQQALAAWHDMLAWFARYLTT